MNDDRVLFSRSKCEDSKSSMDDMDSDENPWDDRRLIEAYDRAVNLAKSSLKNNLLINKEKSSPTDKFVSSKSNNQDTETPPSKISKGKWKIGDTCRAVWSQDGLEYEADIVSFKSNRNHKSAKVKFVGYNNEETVDLNSLKPSRGNAARRKQMSDCLAETEGYDFLSSTANDHSMPQADESMMLPPPPPPHVLSYLPKDEQEALSAMLMSWYMSGYHTGYYQGLTAAKGEAKKK